MASTSSHGTRGCDHPLAGAAAVVKVGVVPMEGVPLSAVADANASRVRLVGKTHGFHPGKCGSSELVGGRRGVAAPPGWWARGGPAGNAAG
jgi:hypothetical protein